MFEDSNRKNSLVESSGALVYLVKANPVRFLFYCGAVPFAVLWMLHNSLWTGFLLEAYIITIGAFVLVPFETQQQDAKQRWFWKAMLRGGVLIHLPLLAGLWYVDATYPSFVTGTATIFFVAFVVAAIEIVALGQTVDRFRPTEQGEGVPPAAG